MEAALQAVSEGAPLHGTMDTFDHISQFQLHKHSALKLCEMNCADHFKLSELMRFQGFCLFHLRA